MLGRVSVMMAEAKRRESEALALAATADDWQRDALAATAKARELEERLAAAQASNHKEMESVELKDARERAAALEKERIQREVPPAPPTVEPPPLKRLGAMFFRPSA